LRIVIGISGASGVIYGITLLQQLKQHGVETHLVLSRWARRIVELETAYSINEVAGMATCAYPPDDMTAPIASGSFLHHGMVIAPCSMKTMAAVAHGYTVNLIERAADVTLKENRRLVLMPRETPLSAIHLENMLKLARLGVVIMPPVPSFYQQPETLRDIVRQSVGRLMDLLGMENELSKRWDGRGITTH